MSLEKLPIELIETIANLLSFEDLKTLRRVNSIFRYLSSFYKKVIKIITNREDVENALLSFPNCIKIHLKSENRCILPEINWKVYTILDIPGLEFPIKTKKNIEILKVYNPITINLNLLPNLKKLTLIYSNDIDVEKSKIKGIGRKVVKLSIMCTGKRDYKRYYIPKKKFPSLENLRTNSSIYFKRSVKMIKEEDISITSYTIVTGVSMHFSHLYTKGSLKYGNCYFYYKK